MYAKMIVVEVIAGKPDVFHAQRTVANLPAVGDWIEIGSGDPQRPAGLQVIKRVWPIPSSGEDDRVYVHCRRSADVPTPRRTRTRDR